MIPTRVSIIIVSFNVQDFLALCLNSVLRATEGISAEVIVVDNHSTDSSCQLVKDNFPTVQLIENSKNLGFSKANNQAFSIAQGEYVHFLNPDTVLPEDFYIRSLDFMDGHPQAGAMGPKLIDGRGCYAPDSKKKFPSFWVSVFKVTGVSRLFPKSKTFNQYYAGDVDVNETAVVDILSGSCLLIRKSAIIAAGGGFDEAYFMYCEDVDLCHRIHLAGFKNYYFPEVAVIHYKGESTRKLSYKYMKVFYQAHALFVKKYYAKKAGILYVNALRAILGVRNLFYWSRHLFSLFKLFLLDAILLTLVTIGVTDLWFNSIAEVRITETDIFFQTIPFFILIWLLSLFLNGAYDKPFSLFKAGRGMVIGTVIVLAWYSLFPLAYRYSRGVVLFSGMTGTVALLLVRYLLSLLRWIRLVPRGKLAYKAAVVCNDEHYPEVLAAVDKNGIQASVLGQITTDPHSSAHIKLGHIKDILSLQQLYGIDEFIFNSNSLSFRELIHLMQTCAGKSFFKIQIPETTKLLGSHYGKNNIEQFLLVQKFIIGTQSARRNKRILDLFTSTFFLFGYLFFSFWVLDKKGFHRNIKSVLLGRKTWVGYSASQAKANQLPTLKEAVLPPHKILFDYQPDEANQGLLATRYAREFSALDDLRYLWINLPYLGMNRES